MKIKDISVEDILKRKYWKILEFDNNDLILSEIVEIKKITSQDTIVHPAVLIERDSRVYPLLVTKYYEDSGEVGEQFFHDGECWLPLDDSIKFVNEIEGEYLGFISELDIHEYQKGSFDNRKSHYEHFDFYTSQIGKSKVEPFQVKPAGLSKKVINSTVPEKIETIRTWLLEAKSLHESQKISQGNKKVRQAYTLVENLKEDDQGRKALRTLLQDPEKYLWMTMMYQLLTVYRDECMNLINKVAREDSLEGRAARMNLETIRKKGKLA